MRVFIIAALTADGFIGRDSGHLADWTGKEDKKIFGELTKEAGVIVMGSKTHATIGRALPGRRNIIYTSQPEKITAEDVETTSEAPAELVKRLADEGSNALAVCGGASVYGMFMRAGVVDELYLTYVPVLFGQGVPLFSGELEQQLELKEETRLSDGSVLMHYIVKK